MMDLLVYVRGGGDLASGIALRLFRAGLRLVIAEIPRPLAVRRTVSFSEAVYEGEWVVEGIKAQLVDNFDRALVTISKNNIPVLIDPQADALIELRRRIRKVVLVDGRMMKKTPELDCQSADLVIGLGPGFIAGENCHAVIETQRGHHLGRVIWQGTARPNTGIPDGLPGVSDIQTQDQRVLRAPWSGKLITHAQISDILSKGQVVLDIDGHVLQAPFNGVLRGLLRSGSEVQVGMKIGDLDPRLEPALCHLVSDKSLAVAGGVLEAILSHQELRPYLWD